LCKPNEAAEDHSKCNIADENEGPLAAVVYGRVRVKMARPLRVLTAGEVHDQVEWPAHMSTLIIATTNLSELSKYLIRGLAWTRVDMTATLLPREAALDMRGGDTKLLDVAGCRDSASTRHTVQLLRRHFMSI
jgi:hypothetical protein